ncbi:MAG: tRNA modification GTPase [Planctomycetes bacterium]|nr:tRNA modification GTPase [Planctomycetota bacterium]
MAWLVLMVEDTIIAISSPVGNSLRGIIRLSGPDAFRLVGASFNRRFPFGSWRSIAGVLKINCSKVPVTLYLMKSPHSYTKEDVVEIHTVGAMPLLKSIVEYFTGRGIRIAQPGEFTRRAFLNGRIGLAQAEAVLNVITATNAREHQLSVASLAVDHFTCDVKTLQQELVGLIGQMEIGLDFSDQLEPVRAFGPAPAEAGRGQKTVTGFYPVPQAGDIEVIPAGQVKAALQSIYARTASLLKSGHSANVHKDGIICVICGKPNVGKSSLFNRLVRERKNIVDAAPGTTRDYIEGVLDYRGRRFRVVDTAGLGEGSNEIAEIADRKTKDALQEADIYLFVVDGRRGMSKPDKDIYRRLDPAKTIMVANKIDLGVRPLFSASSAPPPAPRLRRAGLRCLTSARTGKGIAGLKAACHKLVATRLPERSSSAGLINLRQRDSLNRALDALRRARQSVRTGLSYEFGLVDLRRALDALGEIVGTIATEDILNNIFGQFCIGK